MENYLARNIMAVHGVTEVVDVLDELASFFSHINRRPIVLILCSAQHIYLYGHTRWQFGRGGLRVIQEAIPTWEICPSAK